MKIFATRKKRKSSSSSATTTKRTVNKSDPIAEELLKKDSSEWNAKERRMIKRYRDRNVNESSVEGTDIPIIADEKNEKEEGDTTSEENNGQRGKDIKEQEMKKTDDGEKSNDDYDSNTDAGDESDNSDTDDDDSDNIIDDEVSEVSKEQKFEIEKVEQKNNDDTAHQLPKVEDASLLENNVENTKIDVDATMGKYNDDNDDDGKVNTDHEIWSLLDKLNSKQKRTYSRKLNRMGQSVLDEVEKEVKKILDDTIQENLKRDQTEATGTDNNSNKEVSTENQKENITDSLQPKKKKQKKGADWSSLPADERLRREEQRTKQQEAAERRARGEANIAPGHKRPLNSERRRANRRKPKWVNKSPIGVKQEHNSSGFGHRKFVRQEQQAADNY